MSIGIPLGMQCLRIRLLMGRGSVHGHRDCKYAVHPDQSDQAADYTVHADNQNLTLAVGWSHRGLGHLGEWTACQMTFMSVPNGQPAGSDHTVRSAGQVSRVHTS